MRILIRAIHVETPSVLTNYAAIDIKIYINESVHYGYTKPLSFNRPTIPRRTMHKVTFKCRVRGSHGLTANERFEHTDQ